MLFLLTARAFFPSFFYYILCILGLISVFCLFITWRLHENQVDNSYFSILFRCFSGLLITLRSNKGKDVLSMYLNGLNYTVESYCICFLKIIFYLYIFNLMQIMMLYIYLEAVFIWKQEEVIFPYI